MWSSVGHGHARIQKFNTLMNIPKEKSDCKNYYKKVEKTIDAVHVVDQYWDNKITVCRALWKTSGNLVTKH